MQSGRQAARPASVPDGGTVFRIAELLSLMVGWGLGNCDISSATLRSLY